MTVYELEEFSTLFSIIVLLVWKNACIPQFQERFTLLLDLKESSSAPKLIDKV